MHNYRPGMNQCVSLFKSPILSCLPVDTCDCWISHTHTHTHTHTLCEISQTSYLLQIPGETTLSGIPIPIMQKAETQRSLHLKTRIDRFKSFFVLWDHLGGSWVWIIYARSLHTYSGH